LGFRGLPVDGDQIYIGFKPFPIDSNQFKSKTKKKKKKLKKIGPTQVNRFWAPSGFLWVLVM
jgi:hypothetical protein